MTFDETVKSHIRDRRFYWSIIERQDDSVLAHYALVKLLRSGRVKGNVRRFIRQMGQTLTMCDTVDSR